MLPTAMLAMLLTVYATFLSYHVKVWLRLHKGVLINLLMIIGIGNSQEMSEKVFLDRVFFCKKTRFFIVFIGKVEISIFVHM